MSLAAEKDHKGITHLHLELKNSAAIRFGIGAVFVSAARTGHGAIIQVQLETSRVEDHYFKEASECAGAKWAR